MLNKLTLESEGLTVDYVTFNFDQLNESQKTYLINYFYKLGFNSYETDRKYRNAFDQSIKYNSKNLYQEKKACFLSKYILDLKLLFDVLLKINL